MYSPFVLQSIVAEKTYRCVREGTREEGIFTVPKNYKPIYSSALKCPSNLTQEKAKLVADLRKIFSTGITKMNYVQFFHHLLWYEETVLKNNLKNYNMTGVNLKLGSIPSSYTLVVPGLAEKRPSLLVGDYLFVKPQNEKIMFEANVTLITENDVTIQGMHSTFFKNYSKTKKYDIRFTMSRVTLERMHQAVHFAEQQMPRLFPTHYTNKKKVEPITEFFNVNIRDNLEQRSAVEHIVSGSSGRAPYLVHGPPGTGKTVTIVEAILQLVVRNSKNRILVCTDSNMAADNVATMLIKYAKKFPSEKFLLRASSFYRTWATLPECLHAFSNGTSTKDFWSVSFTVFQKYAIVITTLSHAAKFSGSFSKNSTCHITHLFIDEAAQASEPASLIPICGLLSTAGSLVLAGDPLQLGPVIISQKAKEIGLGLSLMERLMKTFPQYNDVKNDCNYIMLLRNNFRSDPDILHIPNELFYKGQLRAHASEDPISKTDLSGEKPSSRAIMFHGVLSKEQKVGMSPSFYNNSELEIVQMYITFLVNDHRIQLEDIGVITPYIRQAYHIKKWLSSNNYEKIEVGTVESFQGKEKRVIVVSTVRANNDLLAHDAKFQLGFLVDDKRFNVALTRAKAKLIIIGNPLCLRKDKKWQLYMQMCRELGTYFGFDSDNIETDELDRKVDEILPLFRHIEVSKQE
ncbi:RNA helicase Mov10l1 isoform X2 [Bombyx mori]